ncbi:MAG: response regulator [Lachnospiraceae bacterium]|nr:response regulator [Lachnospiraceae bacterium]
MIFNESYNIYFELSVLPIELILLIFVYGNYKDDRDTKATNYRFKIYALLTTVGTLLDIVTGITFMWGDTLPAWFHVIFLSLNFLMGLSSSMGFYFYMVAFSGLQKSERTLNIIAYIINSVYVIILIVNYFTGIAFTYVPGIGLVRNLLYGTVGYLFPLYYIFLGVSLSFFRKKRFTKVQRTFLSSGFLIVLVIFIVQVKLEERAQMAYFVGGICLLMLFLTLETPEYTELVNTLDELDKVRRDEKRALERIKRSDEAKSTFLSHLSHEIKTPINAIMGYTEEILKANVSDEVKENAASAFKGARRLDQFFSDIVDNMSDINEYGNSAFVSLEEIEKELYLNVGFDIEEKKNTRDFISKSGFGSLALPESDIYPDSSMYKVLCVDDNELNMELLVRTVKQFGFSVDGAEDGKTAIELVTKNDYDLILMDHMMPVMDGVEAMHYLRNNSLCDLTPIIVVTANAVRGEREKYISEGFDSFLPKPFTGGSLLRAVGKFLPLATMETLVKEGGRSGISGFMLASTFSRPLIAPGAKILIAGQERECINRFSRLFLTTMARIDVVYGCDECVERLSGGDYDIVFVEDGLRTSDNRSIKTYIWNSVDIPTILITKKNSDIDPAVIFDSYSDYINIDDDADVIDAMLLLYLPKDKVRVIGTGDNRKRFSLDISSSYDLSDGTEKVKTKVVPGKEGPVAELSGECAFLKDVKGIDIEQGLYNCGSEEGLKKAIEIFISTAETKAGEIEELYTDGDIDGYTIRVHALKSSARIIGAIELSELARALEAAGKDRNSEFIGEKTGELLSGYRSLTRELSDSISSDESVEKVPVTPVVLSDAYSAIYELASMMDYDSLEVVFESLRKYDFEKADAERLDRIKRSMEALDWESVLSAAKEAL